MYGFSGSSHHPPLSPSPPVFNHQHRPRSSSSPPTGHGQASLELPSLNSGKGDRNPVPLAHDAASSVQLTTRDLIPRREAFNLYTARVRQELNGHTGFSTASRRKEAVPAGHAHGCHRSFIGAIILKGVNVVGMPAVVSKLRDVCLAASAARVTRPVRVCQPGFMNLQPVGAASVRIRFCLFGWIGRKAGIPRFSRPNLTPSLI